MKAVIGATLVALSGIVSPLSAQDGATTATAAAPRYRTSVIASGLHRPTGIAIRGSDDLYFTELPTPGVPGSAGGTNRVSRLDVETGEIEVIATGEPEPTNLAVASDGDVYWTCKSAGVILRLMDHGGVSLFASGLNKPSGITVWRRNAVVYTEVPTPGVPGSQGGLNNVSVIHGLGKFVISAGEPEPVDVVVSRAGDLYWTCKSAGVILRRSIATGQVTPLLTGLASPTGIALDHKGETLYFTEVPTPGVPGSAGGRNRVRALTLRTGGLRTIDEGDPEPTDIAVARNGNLYWTCTSAGVIVEAKRLGRRE
jgi:sugar lactone lactonase YvrE